ncbi:MAG: hypothetical protein U5P41_12425 [Gammaproteobacteria bacterium]|nr:hypothetical protein [Gammaproteobacteria bacterium]
MIENIISGGLLTVVFACVAVSVFLLILLGYHVSSMVEEENREFMDPLPPLLKLIWPIVQIFAYFVTPLYPCAYPDLGGTTTGNQRRRLPHERGTILRAAPCQCHSVTDYYPAVHGGAEQ